MFKPQLPGHINLEQNRQIAQAAVSVGGVEVGVER